jgi:hypothetical protein
VQRILNDVKPQAGDGAAWECVPVCDSSIIGGQIMRRALCQGFLALLLAVPVGRVNSEVAAHGSIQWSGGSNASIMCQTTSSDPSDKMWYSDGLYLYCRLQTPNYGWIDPWAASYCPWPNPYVGSFSCTNSGGWAFAIGQWELDGYHYGADQGDWVLVLHDHITPYCYVGWCSDYY